jgi:hypothetical protein
MESLSNSTADATSCPAWGHGRARCAAFHGGAGARDHIYGGPKDWSDLVAAMRQEVLTKQSSTVGGRLG